MEKARRKFFLAGFDAVFVNIVVFLMLFIKYGTIPTVYLDGIILYTLIFTSVRLLTLNLFGLYNRVWQYASIGELVSTIRACSVASILTAFIGYFLFSEHLTGLDVVGLLFLDWVLSIFLIGGSRLLWRVYRDSYVSSKASRDGVRVLIVGAGDAGVMVAKEFKNHYQGDMRIVGFVDDDPNKLDAQLLGCKILGNRNDIPQIVKKNRIEEIVIAMPSVEGKVIRAIIDICHTTKAKVKILPGVFELINGKVKVSHIRDVQVEDLLMREPVKADLGGMSAYIEDRVVLVTGAGGSIGSELCRQIITFNPRVLLLFDNCENNMYDIEMSLRSQTDVKLVPLVKDVRDRKAVYDVFKQYRPQVVFHAAAHKHVPLMEINPEEAIKNNCMGTFNVAQAANTYGADRFVLVSTDKAVNPTSVMGASKRVAEMIVQYLNTISKTNYVGVRFGNVLGSRGSVIPLFKKQIAKGGPVTITHQDMVRYFMTIPEAVQLIIQAGALAKGGEIFVLDMGDPVKIMDLASTLIKLSGFEPGVDIDYLITGMRPGEKLYEELLTTEEVRDNATDHKRIFVAPTTDLDSELLENTFQQFTAVDLPNGQAETEQWIQQFLPEFIIVKNEHTQQQIDTVRSGYKESAVALEH